MAYSFTSSFCMSRFILCLWVLHMISVLIMFYAPEQGRDYYHIDIKEAILGIQRGLTDVNTISGIAPYTGPKACDSFKCPVEHKAVRTSYSPDNVENRTMTHYCLCLPRLDATFLDVVLRVADMASTTAMIQEKRRVLRGSQAQVKANGIMASLRKVRSASKRAISVAEDNNFTYVPPPKTDVTPDLLAESLAVQPQDTATAGSIMPHFQDGVISFGVQLNGLIAATMTLNASTSLPCANIGSSSQTQPDLILRPKDIDNGTAQPYIPDCNIVAVNMYDPNVIHYWVINPAGAIFSLVGSNKLMQINQLNSTASISLVLGATTASNKKRDTTTAKLQNGDEIAKRAMSQPDIHTATMTAEACAAIKCNNNGGRAAVFQPFTRTCLCQDPVYVEVEHA